MTKPVFLNLTSKFLADEDGAVTVDWVVLTAAIVVLGVLVVGAISASLTDAATVIGATISSAVT